MCDIAQELGSRWRRSWSPADSHVDQEISEERTAKGQPQIQSLQRIHESRGDD
jgi:hypothetical protein